MFIKRRPSKKPLKASPGASSCCNCNRPLQDTVKYCSLQCKLDRVEFGHRLNSPPATQPEDSSSGHDFPATPSREERLYQAQPSASDESGCASLPFCGLGPPCQSNRHATVFRTYVSVHVCSSKSTGLQVLTTNPDLACMTKLMNLSVPMQRWNVSVFQCNVTSTEGSTTASVILRAAESTQTSKGVGILALK